MIKKKYYLELILFILYMINTFSLNISSFLFYLNYSVITLISYYLIFNKKEKMKIFNQYKAIALVFSQFIILYTSTKIYGLVFLFIQYMFHSFFYIYFYKNFNLKNSYETWLLIYGKKMILSFLNYLGMIIVINIFAALIISTYLTTIKQVNFDIYFYASVIKYTTYVQQAFQVIILLPIIQKKYLEIFKNG